MKKTIALILFLGLLTYCSKDTSEPKAALDAPVVGVITVMDIGESGDGSDLKISFSQVADESLISEYQVVVAKQSSLTAAGEITSFEIPITGAVSLIPDGTDKEIILAEDNVDTDGDLIVEMVSYVIFVISVADGQNAVNNAVSAGSLPIALVDNTPIASPSVENIFVEDISNQGNGSDLQISFVPAAEESLIAAYRVLVVKNTEELDLEVAEQIASDNYTSVTPNGQYQTVTLDSSSKDTDGDQIVASVPYSVHILSVADGVNATINSLSTSAGLIELDNLNLTASASSIKITYIGNDGVYISDGESAVIIDALPGGLGGWNPVARGVQSIIERGERPFDNVKVAMITHAHGDHTSVSSTNRFLQNNASSVLLAPVQVVNGGVAGTESQLRNIELAFDEQDQVTIAGIKIEVLRIRHFNPLSGADFANNTESFAYLIEIGGKKILHLGDGDLSNANFDELGLENASIDIAMIPTFTFSGQLTTMNRDVLVNKIAPKNIIGLHLTAATPITDITALYPEIKIFTKSLQYVRF